jgi:hypothetical protein
LSCAAVIWFLVVVWPATLDDAVASANATRIVLLREFDMFMMCVLPY